MENRIGEARREYAEKVGRFTQADAAEYFSVSLSTYQKWEQGQGMMNGEQLRELSKKYGKSVDYLLMVLPDDPKPADEGNGDEHELTDIYRSITPEGQRALMASARGIAATYSKNNKAAKAC